MSFVRPIKKRPITSMKPMTPDRSMTAKGTGLRRTLLDDRPEDVAAVERQEREQVHDRQRERDERQDSEHVGKVVEDRLPGRLVGTRRRR